MRGCHFQQSCRLTLLKVVLVHECFSRFLNCTNGTKSRKVSHKHYPQVLKLFLIQYSNKRICYVSKTPETVNPFFNHPNKNMNMSVFFQTVFFKCHLECAVFKLLQFIQNIHKLLHIKMHISQIDIYSMVFGPAFLALVSSKL